MKRHFLSAVMAAVVVTVLLSGCSKQNLVKKDDAAPADVAGQTAPAKGADTPESTAIVSPAVAEATPAASSVQAAEERPLALEPIYFDFDAALLSAQSRAILVKNVEQLRKDPSMRLRIEGHCDERGSDEYNLALGEKRARSAWQYMVTMGIPAQRLSVISFGKEKPASPGHDENAWSLNRRDEFIILPQQQ